MTVKTPIAWSSNPAKEVGVTYSSSSVTYSSSATYYSSSTATLSDNGELPAAWTKQSKTASAWLANPDSDNNQYVYDSTAVYDSATRTYDGIVSGEDSLNTSKPAIWTEA